MLSGPMFRREYRAATRGRRPFVFRTFVAAVLGIVTLLIGLVVFRLNPPRTASAQDRIATFGVAVFLATVGVELLILVFSIPAFVGGSVAEERQKDTLPLLLLTRLTPLEIVLTKAAARWLSVTNLVLVGLPIIAASGWLAGLTAEALMAVVGLVSSAGFMSALAILSSAQREQVGTARAQAMAWNFGWLLLPPVLALIPVRSGDLGSELLALLKYACVVIGPSSPLSLLTDPSWYRRPGAVGLEGRVAMMIGLQALLGLAALHLASGRLQAREANPNWADPTRGHRPPCGDDPIYWREYELPIRHGGGSRIALGLRTLWILVRATLLNLMALAGALLAMAVPIGLLVATAHYGLAASREAWQHGYGPAGPFEDRANFNLVVRVATGLLAFLPAMNLIAIVAGRIAAEKDRRSWDTLLTTPLEGGEILRSKARAGVQGTWQLARPLPFLWALGLACGAVTPLGVALTAIDLLLAGWAAVTLGLFLGVRPGETSVAAGRASWITLAFFALQGPLLYGALASPRELAAFASRDPRLWWGSVLAIVFIPILTGAVAWRLTRETFGRFDEWVGRPSRVGRVEMARISGDFGGATGPEPHPRG